MNPNADTIILAAAALAVIVVLSLLVSLWRGFTARRSLRRAQAELRQRDDILNSARVDFRGQAVALEQARAQLEEKQGEIMRLRSEMGALQERLSEALQANAELNSRQQERDSKHQEQIKLLNETRQSLTKDFENLSNRIFEEKGQAFSANSRASLEALLKPFREQISGFQQRINEVHTESVKGNTALESEIKKVLDIGLEMNSQASNLATALKGDKKATGNWGEVQLERALELSGLQSGEHYATQAAFKDEDGKRKLPDFVIKLPDAKSLVVDSKVSLVDYDRAIAADTDEERTEALSAHAAAVRRHIDDLSSKKYASLPGMESPDFVLMFMPIEPAYIEAMKHNKELFNYGYQKGVVMVSHTTLMPILRTVANLWMVDQSNREAREISDRAGDIYNAVCLVAERLLKLGNTLSAARNHYNDTVRGLAGKQGLHGKVDRFAQLSNRVNREMPVLDELHDEVETERLDPLLTQEATAQLVDRESKVKAIKTDKKG